MAIRTRAQLYEERKVKLEAGGGKSCASRARCRNSSATRKVADEIAGAFRILAGANFPSLEVSGGYYDFFPSMNRLIAFANLPTSRARCSPRRSDDGDLPRRPAHHGALHTATARQIARARFNQILLDTVRHRRPRHRRVVCDATGPTPAGVGLLTNAGHNAPPRSSWRRTARFRVIEVEPADPCSESCATRCRIVLAGGTRFRTDGRGLTGVCLPPDGAAEKLLRSHCRRCQSGEERFVRSVRANLGLMPYRLCTALYAASVRAFYRGGGAATSTTRPASRFGASTETAPASAVESGGITGSALQC
mgnify:CR=1 FL=1